jgi:hypothetical protein
VRPAVGPLASSPNRLPHSDGGRAPREVRANPVELRVLRRSLAASLAHAGGAMLWVSVLVVIALFAAVWAFTILWSKRRGSPAMDERYLANRAAGADARERRRQHRHYEDGAPPPI